jgi:hypothetical protein
LGNVYSKLSMAATMDEIAAGSPGFT